MAFVTRKLQPPGASSDKLAAIDVLSNRPIPAIRQIELFSFAEWEELIEEWATTVGPNYGYVSVERWAGSGDMGVDVVAYKSNPPATSKWVAFQGKHYTSPLTPSEAYVELGKLCYYTYIGAYSVPDLYYFVSPRGVGTKLATLFKKPDQLRKLLIENWDTKCKAEITKTTQVALTGPFKVYVEHFNFGIFRTFSAAKLVEEHSKTQWHAARFQTGLPPRGPNIEPPAAINSPLETRYVQQLLDAYGDCLGHVIGNVESLPSVSTQHADHLQRSREHFYSAESLRNFSRDTLPDGEFERLQNEVCDGVIDKSLEVFPNGFQRLIATILFARQLQLTSHPLIHRLESNDRAGICHQLANNDRLRWVP